MLRFAEFRNKSNQVLNYKSCSVCENRGTFSAFRRVIVGVPQGSVVAPLHLHFFINVLILSSQNFRYMLFADDTNSISVNTFETHFDIEAIHNW